MHEDGIRTTLADMLARIAKGLAHAMGRSASATPGEIARKIDSRFIAKKSILIPEGRSIVVCGTNGKTTVTNMLATVAKGLSEGTEVVCNSEGANMATGVATALVGARHPDWGIFEVDELATRLVLPDLQPDVFVLLNLFRDQMDRSGEIDHTQDVIASSLVPLIGRMVLVANADDPLVADVGMRYEGIGGRVVWFGIGSGLRIRKSNVNEARICPVCGSPLCYSYQTYAMMGHYSCPNGDFARPKVDYETEVTKMDSESCAIKVTKLNGRRQVVGSCSVRAGGAYMAYNLTAVAVAAYVSRLAAPFDVTETLRDFHPKNGRLQHMNIASHSVLLNLAKNPTGFNQNIDLVCENPHKKVVCISINDEVQDGHDISWIWDVDFERLCRPDVAKVFVAGLRAGDVAIRMRYAGIEAEQVDRMSQMFDRIRSDEDSENSCLADIYVLCNYTALWPAKAELEKLEQRSRHD